MNTKLRETRAASGKSQAQIAKDVGISESQYQNIEHGKNEPRVGTAIRIARAVGSSVEELFGAELSSGI